MEITGQGEGKSDEEIAFMIAKDVMQAPEVIVKIAELMFARGFRQDKLDKDEKTYCVGFLDGLAIMFDMLASGKLEVQIIKKEVK